MHANVPLREASHLNTRFHLVSSGWWARTCSENKKTQRFEWIMRARKFNPQAGRAWHVTASSRQKMSKHRSVQHSMKSVDKDWFRQPLRRRRKSWNANSWSIARRLTPRKSFFRWGRLYLTNARKLSSPTSGSIASKSWSQVEYSLI